MLALEEPNTTPKHSTRNQYTWTPEQAAQARTKSLETRRRKAIERKAVAAKAQALVNQVCSEQPIAHVERALSLAAKHGKAKAVESLASALAKLKRAGVGRTEQPSASYTTTPSSPVRQPTPRTPQVTQGHATQAHATEPSFAQCTEPLVGQGKESLLSAGVATGCPGGTGPGAGGGGVIEANTRGSNPSRREESFDGRAQGNNSTGVGESVVDEIRRLEARLAQLKAQLNQVQNNPKPSSVGIVPSGSVVGVGVSSVGPVTPQEVMEKFCVGGRWILGKRTK